MEVILGCLVVVVAIVIIFVLVLCHDVDKISEILEENNIKKRYKN